MNIISSLHLRSRLGALLIAGLLSGAGGCASNSNAPADTHSPAGDARAAQQGAQVHRRDPFEVARVWAVKLPGAKADAERLSPEVQSITASWSVAQVARVWAAAGEYRALIIEKSTAGQRPAVLLYISSDPGGAWHVKEAKPSTSTALWSEF